MCKVTRISVYGIILNNGKILLVKKQRGPYTDKWDLPGGGIETGEDTQEALAREIAEECGYNATTSKLVDVINNRIEYTNDRGILEELTLISLIYSVSLEQYEKQNEGNIIHSSEDVSDSQWIDINHVATLPMTPNVKYFMETFKRKFCGYRIEEILDNDKKSEYANLILRKLPDWFGVEESLQDYVNTVYKYSFWAAFDKEKCIGFFSGKIHHNRTGDIYVCGVDPEYHGKGIGTSLFNELEGYCKRNNCEYIIVKTVDETDSQKAYGKTVKFYESIEFRKLITIPEVWDEYNPCLIMIKKI